MDLSFNGLSTSDAKKRLQTIGPNTLPEKKLHPLLIFLKKLWAPIPWLLEIVILLELILGKEAESLIILTLLLFNVILSFLQEDKAQKALLLLKKRLHVQSRILRDGKWTLLAAEEIVPDDIIEIRMGDIIPADIEILQGELLVDQSALTGESLPQDLAPGKKGFAGSTVQHGEALAKIIATGSRTYYGQTTEIVRTAVAPSHLQKTIRQIIQYLVSFNSLLILGVFLYSIHLPLTDLIPFCLLLLVASVPVALPATYTLATALGSLELARFGILVTRLSAIEEAAAMNVLCIDKTGTITQNTLAVSAIFPDAPYSKEDLLVLASFASEEATQDPIDLAIIRSAKGKSSFTSAKRTQFIPFDPDRKCSEAIIQLAHQEMHVKKGAPATLLPHHNVLSDGARMIAVILDNHPVGLIALKDPPRLDSKQAIQDLQNLGIRVIMLTGDNISTARTIAAQVGIKASDVMADVFPQDKFQIIRDLQKNGLICGMTGDGVNDAPALKQAEVGIAVSNATDVAKASASLVLTQPGLSHIVQAIQTSRRIYQRMLTYTLNKIIKTLEIALLLSIGLILTHHFIISQILLVLLLFTNDFLTMSISTDHVSFSQTPDRWNVQKLMRLGGTLAAFTFILSFSILEIAERFLPFDQVQTIVFLTLVMTGQANVYLVRERRHFWKSCPSVWMFLSSSIAIALIVTFAMGGILMEPVSIGLIGTLLMIIVLYYTILDLGKSRAFETLDESHR